MCTVQSFETGFPEMIESETRNTAGERKSVFLTARGVMWVFCNECGKPVPDGSKFCLSCGTPLPAVETAAPPPVVAAPTSPNEPKPEKKGGGGFFSSPAGIVLVVILAVAVIGGITLGAVFLVKGSSSNAVDAETMKAWDEYEALLSESSADLPRITTDQAGLQKAQADLKKAQEKVTALEKVVKETAGTQAYRTSRKKPTNTRDIKAEQMAGALAAYNLYVQKMNELFTTLIGANLADQNVVNELNTILSELQKLGNAVKTLSNQFLANNPKATTTKIDQPILTVASAFETEIQKNVTAAKSGQPPSSPSPAPSQSTTPSSSVVGTYGANGATVTLNADGTLSASNPEVSLGGTYTVSGNTVTFTSEQGKVDTGTIQADGSILLSNGVLLTKQ
jgi:hypothetical protein